MQRNIKFNEVSCNLAGRTIISVLHQEVKTGTYWTFLVLDNGEVLGMPVHSTCPVDVYTIEEFKGLLAQFETETRIRIQSKEHELSALQSVITKVI